VLAVPDDLRIGGTDTAAVRETPLRFDRDREQFPVTLVA
jgi:hypothetical protein